MKLKRMLFSLLLMLLLAASPVMAEERGDFDSNGDGQITFEEMMQRLEKSARAAFDSMDRNKDGVLSDKDFDDVREGMERLERWLEELLEPFLQDEEPERIEV